MAREVEIQRKHTALERGSKPSLPRTIPLAIDDLEGNIFIRRSRMKANDAKFIRVGGLQKILRRLVLVNEIWVKDVELIALHSFRGRVVMIVMRLIVLIPVVARLDAVKVTRLARPILVLP